MSRLRKRLDDIEERRAFEEFKTDQRQFGGRTKEELEFFAVHGFFPENAGEELPSAREFTLAGVRTIITAEKA